ncbi:MAG: hypothetical protein H7839_02960 [Magnetococcus sp. YQC-5]
MNLNDFSYYFCVKGSQGGLFSITFEFLSESPTETPVVEFKKTVKADFETLESMLDDLFLGGGPISQGEKIPSLVDSPSSIDTGFDYKGEHASSLSSRLCCRIKKNTTDHVSPILKLEIQAEHDLNVQMFTKIIDLPGLNISNQAANEIEHLHQILSMGKEIDPKKLLDLQ